MSDNSIQEAETLVIVEAKDNDVSSEEPPMSEWSSLEIKLKEDNVKRTLYEAGLYDPGSGEICTAYFAQSDSEVFRHPYYNYPSIPDPGIEDALLQPPSKVTYPNDGQELYLATCEVMNQCPVRIFLRSLLTSQIDLSYYGVHTNGFRAMAIALQNNGYVKQLNLTDNWMNDDACFHFGEMLVINSTLTELNLYGCRIGASGTRRLCQGLPTNRGLRALNLGHNQIGDEGIEFIARAISLLSDIRVLDLSFNAITGKGAQFLAEALEGNNKLTSLDMSYNNLFSFSSGLFNVLEQLGTNPEFQYLNLSWNALSGRKIAMGIRDVFQCKHLVSIDLNNNKFGGTETIEPLAAGMITPEEMTSFNLSFNPLTEADALLVIKKFQNAACKINELNLDGVTVNKKFLNILQHIKHIKKNVVVTYGYARGVFESSLVIDARDLILNRIEYVAKKNKKRQMDIALVVLQLLRDNIDLVEVKELTYIFRPYGVVFDDDLLNEVQNLWPGPPTKKGAKRIDLKILAEYIKRKWPDRELPPPPPPGAPEPVKKKGKK